MTTAQASQDPELSVVMVTHGAWQLAERAVEALHANTERAYELIIVDNASPNETRDRLPQLADAKLILNERNRGFGPGSNQGAALARGEYLVLLNSDAFVHHGWLQPLLEALAQPAVGAVVPRYLNADGTLQEAGALIARDGTVHVYGEGHDAEIGSYRFRRAVDYGSAVCMLIRRETFMALGGFDERYAPAYYEDADLCLRLAECGLPVVYEPRSTVTHVRYGSGGADAAATLSERNRRLFAQTWRSRLAGRPITFERASDQTVIIARDALATPRLLICSPSGEPGVEELVGTLVSGWLRGRFTWVTEGVPSNGFDLDGWLTAGVEVLEQRDPSWLRGRLFHYDAVLIGAGTSGPLLEAIRRTQPQAPQIALRELAETHGELVSQLVPLLARAGIAPPARAYH